MTGACFAQEPLPPDKPAKKKKKKRRDKLPYTSICNSAMSMGLSRDDILEMSWGELVLTLQAWSTSSGGRSEDDGVREASWAEITAWAGVPL